MAGQNTLERTPHQTQVFCRALLDAGESYRSIKRLTGLSCNTITAISRRHDYKIEAIEAVRKRLPAKAYALADEAMNHISEAKLASCSAPQLAMVSGVFIDKARDMEGMNRPIINVVDLAMSLQKSIAEAQSRAYAIEGHLTTLLPSGQSD